MSSKLYFSGRSSEVKSSTNNLLYKPKGEISAKIIRSFSVLFEPKTANDAVNQPTYHETSFQILREVWVYMSVITNLAGVSFNDSKTAMRELLVFEGHLALVSQLQARS